MSVNKAILVGNLGADPVIRTINSGEKVANLRLATNKKWVNRAGKTEEKTEWHSIAVFNNKLADVIEQYCKKGMKLYVEGEIRTRNWQDKDGGERYTTEIFIAPYNGKIEMLSSPSAAEKNKRIEKNTYKSKKKYDIDDDIPF